MAACRTEGVRDDLNEVIDSVSPASETNFMSYYLVHSLLAGGVDLDACRLLLPLFPHFSHCRWRSQPTRCPGELDVIAAMQDLILFEFHASLLFLSAEVYPVYSHFMLSLVFCRVGVILVYLSYRFQYQLTMLGELHADGACGCY